MRISWETHDVKAGTRVVKHTDTAEHFMIVTSSFDSPHNYRLVSLKTGLIITRGLHQAVLADFLNSDRYIPISMIDILPR